MSVGLARGVCSLPLVPAQRGEVGIITGTATGRRHRLDGVQMAVLGKRISNRPSTSAPQEGPRVAAGPADAGGPAPAVLEYLRREDIERYRDIVAKLGLRR
jgi:hypothetical protein